MELRPVHEPFREYKERLDLPVEGAHRVLVLAVDPSPYSSPGMESVTGFGEGVVSGGLGQGDCDVGCSVR